MAKRFPRTESDIATLAGRVIDGFTNAAEDFPTPPVSSEELRGKLDAFQAAETAFRNQHAEKDPRSSARFRVHQRPRVRVVLCCTSHPSM